MRCIKCLLNFSGKKIYLLCSVLLSCLLCLSGVLSTSVSAVTQVKRSVTIGFLNSSGAEISRASYNEDNLAEIPSGTAGFRLYFPAFNINDVFQFNVSFALVHSTSRIFGFTGGGCNFVNSVDTWDSDGSALDDDSVIFVISGAFSSCPTTATDHLDFLFSPGITLGSSEMYISRATYAGTDTGLYGRLYTVINLLNDLKNNLSKQNVQDAVGNAIDSQQQEAQEQFQDNQDDAGSDSDSSSQQATSSGTTLLAGFQSFLGALTGASPSNCVISADLGNMDLGNIDLCQLDPPPAFQAISSIMVIGFTVPLSIALGRKMIALFRSFQT